jgi:hypothetical protein
MKRCFLASFKSEVKTGAVRSAGFKSNQKNSLLLFSIIIITSLFLEKNFVPFINLRSSKPPSPGLKINDQTSFRGSRDI